jgi:predicted nucleic acid-binding protein
MAGAVITNAGPLMALAKLNLLHLLKQLYGRVQFPRSVYEEVVIEGINRGFEDAHTLRLFLSQENWEPTEVEDVPDDLASLHLDRGERESIALALALDGMLLIDEERGREEARRRGITVRGTLGVLIQAYRSGLITADQLCFYFGQIEERTDIWISPRLCHRLLREVLGPSAHVPEE